MAVFLVRRSLPHLPGETLDRSLARLRATVAQMRREGHEIRYLSSAFVAADGFCGCMFEADSAEVVRLVNERAAVPYDVITPADLRLGDLPAEDATWEGKVQC